MIQLTVYKLFEQFQITRGGLICQRNSKKCRIEILSASMCNDNWYSISSVYNQSVIIDGWNVTLNNPGD